MRRTPRWTVLRQHPEKPLRYTHLMSRMVRMLLIWLLALAIPAQGVAASTMAFCGPKHHGGVAAAAADLAATASHVHGGLEAAAAHEHPRADANTPVAGEPGVSAKAKVSSADQHKCSVCGACCSTGALMSARRLRKS